MPLPEIFWPENDNLQIVMSDREAWRVYSSALDKLRNTSFFNLLRKIYILWIAIALATGGSSRMAQSKKYFAED